MNKPRPLEAILYGGLAVAVLDIANAMTFWALYRQVSPVRILQSIAVGLLGQDAFAGGANTALFGAGLHLLISFGVAAVFYAGCRMWPAWWRQPWVTGPAYGVLVYAVMNYVVIPLSRVPPAKAFSLPWFLDNLIGHALLIGLPVALIARWSVSKPGDTA